ncbi:hypothetical protein [Streptomyces avidinii]|uniref:Uncharacterized protein n=1 Tax=Streptomyces avidinii TaxID=1895 RepID=A0ABS4KXF3_STRAV|nr:hypothetical protein [Streptomyces avidinii]MBP2034709.1 hypothetical protein [Streptomyces avidinii]
MSTGRCPGRPGWRGWSARSRSQLNSRRFPGDGATARAELHTAAARALEAAGEGPGTDVRAEPAAVRAGCRRSAVAVGLYVPVAC